MKKLFLILSVLAISGFGNFSHGFDEFLTTSGNYEMPNPNEKPTVDTEENSSKPKKTVVVLIPLRNPKSTDKSAEKTAEHIHHSHITKRCKSLNAPRKTRRIVIPKDSQKYFSLSTETSIESDINDENNEKTYFRLASMKDTKNILKSLLNSKSAKRENNDAIFSKNFNEDPKLSFKQNMKNPKKYICYCIEENCETGKPKKKPSRQYGIKRPIGPNILSRNDYFGNAESQQMSNLLGSTQKVVEAPQNLYCPPGAVLVEESDYSSRKLQNPKRRPVKKCSPMIVPCSSEIKSIGQPTRINIPLAGNRKLDRQVYRVDRKLPFVQRLQSAIEQNQNMENLPCPESEKFVGEVSNFGDNYQQNEWRIPLSPDLVYPHPYVVYPGYPQYGNGLVGKPQFVKPFEEPCEEELGASYQERPLGRNYIDLEECMRLYGPKFCIVTTTTVSSIDEGHEGNYGDEGFVSSHWDEDTYLTTERPSHRPTTVWAYPTKIDDTENLAATHFQEETSDEDDVEETHRSTEKPLYRPTTVWAYPTKMDDIENLAATHFQEETSDEDDVEETHRSTEKPLYRPTTVWAYPTKMDDTENLAVTHAQEAASDEDDAEETHRSTEKPLYRPTTVWAYPTKMDDIENLAVTHAQEAASDEDDVEETHRNTEKPLYRPTTVWAYPTKMDDIENLAVTHAQEETSDEDDVEETHRSTEKPLYRPTTVWAYPTKIYDTENLAATHSQEDASDENDEETHRSTEGPLYRPTTVWAYPTKMYDTENLAATHPGNNKIQQNSNTPQITTSGYEVVNWKQNKPPDSNDHENFVDQNSPIRHSDPNNVEYLIPIANSDESRTEDYHDVSDESGESEGSQKFPLGSAPEYPQLLTTRPSDGWQGAHKISSPQYLEYTIKTPEEVDTSKEETSEEVGSYVSTNRYSPNNSYQQRNKNVNGATKYYTNTPNAPLGITRQHTRHGSSGTQESEQSSTSAKTVFLGMEEPWSTSKKPFTESGFHDSEQITTVYPVIVNTEDQTVTIHSSDDHINGNSSPQSENLYYSVQPEQHAENVESSVPESMDPHRQPFETTKESTKFGFVSNTRLDNDHRYSNRDWTMTNFGSGTTPSLEVLQSRQHTFPATSYRTSNNAEEVGMDSSWTQESGEDNLGETPYATTVETPDISKYSTTEMSPDLHSQFVGSQKSRNYQQSTERYEQFLGSQSPKTESLSMTKSTDSLSSPFEGFATTKKTSFDTKLGAEPTNRYNGEQIKDWHHSTTSVDQRTTSSFEDDIKEEYNGYFSSHSYDDKVEEVTGPDSYFEGGLQNLNDFISKASEEPIRNDNDELYHSNVDSEKVGITNRPTPAIISTPHDSFEGIPQEENYGTDSSTFKDDIQTISGLEESENLEVGLQSSTPNSDISENDNGVREKYPTEDDNAIIGHENSSTNSNDVFMSETQSPNERRHPAESLTKAEPTLGGDKENDLTTTISNLEESTSYKLQNPLMTAPSIEDKATTTSRAIKMNQDHFAKVITTSEQSTPPQHENSPNFADDSTFNYAEFAGAPSSKNKIALQPIHPKIPTTSTNGYPKKNWKPTDLSYKDRKFLKSAVRKVIKDLISPRNAWKNRPRKLDTVGAPQQELPSALPILKKLFSLPEVKDMALSTVKGLISEVTGTSPDSSLSRFKDHVIESVFNGVLNDILPKDSTPNIDEHRTVLPTSSAPNENIVGLPDGRISNIIQNIISRPGIGLHGARSPVVQNIIVHAVENALAKVKEVVDHSVIWDALNDVMTRAENSGKPTEKPVPALPKAPSLKIPDGPTKHIPVIPVVEHVFKDGQWSEKNTVLGNARQSGTKFVTGATTTTRSVDQGATLSSSYPNLVNNEDGFGYSTNTLDYALLGDSDEMGNESTTKDEVGSIETTVENVGATPSQNIGDDEDLEKAPIKYYSPQDRILDYIKNHQTTAGLRQTTSPSWNTDGTTGSDWTVDEFTGRNGLVKSAQAGVSESDEDSTQLYENSSLGSTEKSSTCKCVDKEKDEVATNLRSSSEESTSFSPDSEEENYSELPSTIYHLDTDDGTDVEDTTDEYIGEENPEITVNSLQEVSTESPLLSSTIYHLDVTSDDGYSTEEYISNESSSTEENSAQVGNTISPDIQSTSNYLDENEKGDSEEVDTEEYVNESSSVTSDKSEEMPSFTTKSSGSDVNSADSSQTLQAMNEQSANQDESTSDSTETTVPAKDQVKMANIDERTTQIIDQKFTKQPKHYDAVQETTMMTPDLIGAAKSHHLQEITESSSDQPHQSGLPALQSTENYLEENEHEESEEVSTEKLNSSITERPQIKSGDAASFTTKNSKSDDFSGVTSQILQARNEQNVDQVASTPEIIETTVHPADQAKMADMNEGTTQILDPKFTKFQNPDLIQQTTLLPGLVGAAKTENQHFPENMKSSSNCVTPKWNPTYFGKISLNNVNPGVEKITDLEDTDLFYVGDGVKIPLVIKKMADGSFALSISEKICDHFIKRKCPCCVPEDGEVIEERRQLNDPEEVEYDSSSKKNHDNSGDFDTTESSEFGSKSKKRFVRSTSGSDIIVTSASPVDSFVKKYNLTLNLQRDQDDSLIANAVNTKEVIGRKKKLGFIKDTKISNLFENNNKIQRDDSEEKTVIDDDDSGIKSKQSNTIRRSESNYDVDTNSFIRSLMNIKDIPEYKRAEVVINALDGLMNLGPTKNLEDDESTFEDNSEYNLEDVENEMARYGYQKDNPILERIRYIKEQQNGRGQQYKYQRNIDRQAEGKMNVLKTVLHWLREVFLEAKVNNTKND